jgi:Ca2+-binding EF-hand superfamily protein
MSKKIFDAMDANKNNSIHKKEMMALVNAFFQGIPKEALKMIKQMGGSESEMKAAMDEALF